MINDTKVSIITPTRDRAFFLDLCKECVLSQTHPNLEWLILDDSETPNPAFSGLQDDTIRYVHSSEPVSIGEKRNRLIEMSKGEIIVNFDDDDYYAPEYVAHVLAHLNTTGADLINLRGFFIYNANNDKLAYWDLMQKQGLHYYMSGHDIDSAWSDPETNRSFDFNHLGYGFGWTFKKDVWRANPYPDMNWYEDGEFAVKALEKFDLQGLNDDRGLCLHIIHLNNTSISYPQYLMPGFFMKQFFPVDKIHQYIKS